MSWSDSSTIQIFFIPSMTESGHPRQLGKSSSTTTGSSTGRKEHMANTGPNTPNFKTTTSGAALHKQAAHACAEAFAVPLLRHLITPEWSRPHSTSVPTFPRATSAASPRCRRRVAILCAKTLCACSPVLLPRPHSDRIQTPREEQRKEVVAQEQCAATSRISNIDPLLNNSAMEY